MDAIERGPRRSGDRPRPLVDAVLRLIWREREISRAEIARRADLSRSTVSEVVGLLLPGGLVAEVGTGESRGGRRPIVLQFQDAACSLLGVEIGATHIAVALTDLRCRVLEWDHRMHAVREDPSGTRRLLVRMCERVLARHGGDSLVGIGVAMPSPIDPKRPEHLSEVVLPAWSGRHGLEVLVERFGVPILVDNDANLGALAERWWGAGRDLDDFAYIKLATGVGSGHVIGGELYRGANGVAGEIGHMSIDSQGPPCVCGLRGCLTTFVGSQAVVARADALRREHPESALAEGPLDIARIEDAALAGDPLALQLAREAGEHLGVAIAGMLNLMNPSAVVLGGGLTRMGELLLAPIQDTVRRRTLVSSADASSLRMSELGPRAGAIGAATIVLQTALHDSRMFPRPHAAGA
jgi:glucokinase-like ROK family protein